ncbi:MAG: GDP-L-fucose synthase [Candidatus Omnitrophica bacterium]|nr:GDP-L-fucose synthase [Candidatus Omnitrophota bacterium]
MNKNARIYIAGHRGMVGSAITRKLEAEGYTNLLKRTHKELDLTRQQETEDFFAREKPEYVFIAAARVGGIMANSTYKADFIYQNIMIAANIIEASRKFGVKKLLNLGSTCIYPKLAPQPLKEESLLTGPLEPTNDAYAVAKISAIRLCRHYNEQHGTNFISAMPTNLYGPNDNYDLFASHVLPAMIRKFYLAKKLAENDFTAIANDFKKRGSLIKEGQTELSKKEVVPALASFGIRADSVTLWGTGSPYREFLHADDLAQACLFLLLNCDAKDIGEFVNVGSGQEHTIKEIAVMVKDIVGFSGEITWDTSKPDGTPRKISDVSRINKLGWRSTIDLKTGIESVVREL